MVNIDPKKRAYLVNILGEEEADKICMAAETLTKALEADGIAYKDDDSWDDDSDDDDGWDEEDTEAFMARLNQTSPILRDIIGLRLGEGTMPLSDKVADLVEDDYKTRKDPAYRYVLDLLRGAIT